MRVLLLACMLFVTPATAQIVIKVPAKVQYCINGGYAKQCDAGECRCVDKPKPRPKVSR